MTRVICVKENNAYAEVMKGLVYYIDDFKAYNAARTEIYSNVYTYTVDGGLKCIGLFPRSLFAIVR